MPAIIRFLGYTPLPEATTLAERLVRHRTTLGMSQKEAARELGGQVHAGRQVGQLEKVCEGEATIAAQG